MTEIAEFEVSDLFDDLLDRVERGGELVITRHGKPVARLTPLAENFDRAAAIEAVARLRESRKGVTLGGISIRELIDEGRR